MQLLQGTLFRGCSHSVMFRLPCSLGPQVAPTAEAHSLRAAGPFTPRNEHVVTHMSCGIATYLNRAIDMAGLSPAGLQPCRLLPRSGREDFPHPVPRLPKAGGQWQTRQATPRLAHNFAALQAFRCYGLSWALETGSLIELPQTFPS
jgi:hypothetical protein